MAYRIIEMLKCTECEGLKEYIRGGSNDSCGDCRTDSLTSVFVCGRCTEREVEGRFREELCAACSEDLKEEAREYAIDQRIKA